MAHGAVTESWNQGFTRLYAAPEQIEDRETDERTDLYGLARTTIALLNWTPENGLMPPPARDLASFRLPTQLENLLRSMLHYDPEGRPRDARAALRLLGFAPSPVNMKQVEVCRQPGLKRVIALR